jgi:iron-sulfur cluster assembly protein
MENPTSAFPVNITPEALAQLARIVKRKGQPGAHIRIGVKGGGCSGYEYVVKLDTRTVSGDAVLQVEDLKVVCDPKSAQFLNGATLFYTGNLIGGAFKFENPNAKKSCGCGSSFVLK